MRPLTVILVATLAILASPSKSSAQWVMEVIGQLDGKDAYPAAINDSGQVVGQVDVSHVGGAGTPFLWTRGGGVRKFLDDLFSYDVIGWANDINNRGDIVGVIAPPGSLPRGFLWNDATGYIDLDQFHPIRINDHGVMIGMHAEALQSMVWDPNGPVTLISSPDGSVLSLTDINSAGDVVGGQFLRAVDGTFQKLEAPALPWTFNARAINDRGLIVGTAADGNDCIVVWDMSGALLHTLCTDTYNEFDATALSDTGIVVGTDWEGLRGLAWAIGSPSVVYLPIRSDYYRGIPTDINQRNDVVGWTQGSEGRLGVAIWRYTPRRLHIATPNTLSRWGLNTRQRLAWTYEGDAPQFQIEFSYNGGRTWDFVSVAENKPGPSQNFSWTVTGPLTSTGRWRVTAVGDEAATDVSDGNIQIRRPYIEVLLPRHPIRTGTVEKVFWKHNLGANAPVAIDVSTNGGGTWQPLIARTLTTGADTSSLSWTVNVPPVRHARIRVRALDGSGAKGTSYIFPVTAPQ